MCVQFKIKFKSIVPQTIMKHVLKKRNWPRETRSYFIHCWWPRSVEHLVWLNWSGSRQTLDKLWFLLPPIECNLKLHQMQFRLSHQEFRQTLNIWWAPLPFLKDLKYNHLLRRSSNYDLKVKTYKMSWYFSISVNFFSKSTPSSNHAIGKYIGCKSFINSTDSIGTISTLIWARPMADSGAPAYYNSMKWMHRKFNAHKKSAFEIGLR